MIAIQIFLYLARNWGKTWEKSMGTIIFDNLVVFVFIAIFLHFLFVR